MDDPRVLIFAGLMFVGVMIFLWDVVKHPDNY